MTLSDLGLIALVCSPLLLFGWLFDAMTSGTSHIPNPNGCAACGADRPDDHDMDEPGWCDHCADRNKEKK